MCKNENGLLDMKIRLVKAHVLQKVKCRIKLGKRTFGAVYFGA